LRKATITIAALKEFQIQLQRESRIYENTFYTWFYTNEANISRDQNYFVEDEAECK